MRRCNEAAALMAVSAPLLLGQRGVDVRHEPAVAIRPRARMHRIDTTYAQWRLTVAAAFRASLPAQRMGQARKEYRQMLKMLVLALTTLLMDRFDWFVMGVMLTGVALIAYLYW